MSALQVFGSLARRAQGHHLLQRQLIEIHRTIAAALADHQMRYSQVRHGVMPDAQAGRRLLQAWRQIHLARAGGPFQGLQIRIQAPVRRDAHAFEQTLHQFDIGARQLSVLATQNPRCLLDQAHPQHGMLLEPGALLSIESRA